jgi:hypothetical protein
VSQWCPKSKSESMLQGKVGIEIEVVGAVASAPSRPAGRSFADLTIFPDFIPESAHPVTRHGQRSAGFRSRELGGSPKAWFKCGSSRMSQSRFMGRDESAIDCTHVYE